MFLSVINHFIHYFLRKPVLDLTVVYCQLQIRLFESLDKQPKPDSHADEIIHNVIAMERASLK